MLPALATVGVLITGAGLTIWLESLLTPREAEAGPAAPPTTRRDMIPEQTDPWTYYAGPLVALLGVAWAVACIPFDPRLVAADVNIGLFYFIVVVDFVVLAVALGTWGGNTPASVEACYRIIAQLLAYVIPLGLAILGPIMMARSLSTVEIAEAQLDSGLWYIVPQPLAFALYIVTALMQVYRAPFLEPFANGVDRGVLGVFGGWKAVAWRIALSGLLFVVAALGAVIFLGAYGGPWLPGPVWMVLKTFALMALMLWLGRRVRPLSTAEMLALSWKILIPVGLINVLIVGGLILLGVGQEPFPPVGGGGSGG